MADQWFQEDDGSDRDLDDAMDALSEFTRWAEEDEKR